MGDDKRGVRFRDELCDTRFFEEDPTVTFEEIWYSGTDFIKMKAESRSDVKTWRRHGFDELLHQTFLCPGADAEECINAFCLLDETLSKRGLEKFLSRQHFQERKGSRERAKFSVLVHQRQMRQRGAQQDEIERRIREVYTVAAGAASVFARRLGQGDELYVTMGEDTRHAERILQARGIDTIGDSPRRRVQRTSSSDSIGSVDSFDSARYNGKLKSPIRRGGKRPSTNSPKRPGGTNELPPIPTELSLVYEPGMQ